MSRTSKRGVKRALVGLLLATTIACKPKPAPGEVWVEPKTAPALAGLDVRSDRPRSLADERGHAVMIAFGYTSCADVCPTTLAAMHTVFSELGASADRASAFYVTVDPERDRPPEFRDFMAHFDERIHGIYVEPAALGPLLGAYGAVAVKRPPNLRRYVGHDVDPNTDYSIDHSAGMWVVDPRGRLRAHYAYDSDPAVVARGLLKLLEETPEAPSVEHARLVTHRMGSGAAYFTLKSRSAHADRLLRAASPAARSVELHETVHDGDVVRMRPADAGFELPAGASVVLREGGKHLMLNGLTLASDTRSVPLVLEFERAGRVSLELPLESEGDAVAPTPANARDVTAAALMPLPAATAEPALVATASAPARRTLSVCADPNNLPFSNRAREGFENRLAEVVARALDADLAYTFWPQRRGFLRMTLNAGRCDVVMGVPVGTERVLTTKPYYRSGYVFVYGEHAPRVRSFDAPELAELRIGVPLVGDDGANPPPMAALARRHLVANLRGYSVYGDYRNESPPSELIEAVRRNEVDLAVAWGPLAGYYAARAAPKLALFPVPEGPGGPETFRFEIAMAVRRDDARLQAELDRVIAERHAEIGAILREFNVPRL